MSIEWDPDEDRDWPLETYAAAAVTFPDRIADIYSGAVHDASFERHDVIRALVEAGALDVNLVDRWPGDSHEPTTLLLSCLEYRDAAAVELLLRLGADVHALDGYGLGAIDTILYGHSLHSTTCPQSCVEMLDLVLPFDPPREISRATRECFDDDWDEYRDCGRIVEVVESCRIR